MVVDTRSSGLKQLENIDRLNFKNKLRIMTDYRPLRKSMTEEQAQDRSDRKHLKSWSFCFSTIFCSSFSEYLKESPFPQYNREANERIKLSVRGNEEERRVIQIGESGNFANGRKGRERIDIDGAFSSIKNLQLDVIDGLRASIKVGLFLNSVN